MKKKKIINIKKSLVSTALVLSTIITGITTASAQNLNHNKDFDSTQIFIDTSYQKGSEPIKDNIEKAMDLGAILKPKTDWKNQNILFEVKYDSVGKICVLRPHYYKLKSVTNMSNNDGTHKNIFTVECKTCGKELTLQRDVLCDYGITFDDDYEYRTCKECNYEDQAKHKFDNGKIEGKTITYTCMNAGCDYSYSKKYTPSYEDDFSFIPSHTHSHGNWVFLDEELEANYCLEDGALIETREHSYKTGVNIVSNNDGTHNIITTTKCNTCNYEKEPVVKHNISCRFDGGTLNNAETKITYTCLDCGYQKIEDYTHQHSEAPSDLIYTYSSSNNDGTHNLAATYTCTKCGQEINLTKVEDCNYTTTYKSIGYTNPNNIHNVVYTCDICDYEKTEEEACTKVGEKKYVRIYDNIYEYYDCAVCGGYVDRDYHNEHNYSDWQYYDDRYHERVCPCGGSFISSDPNLTLEEEENLLYKQKRQHVMKEIDNEMKCLDCGYTIPKLDHIHAVDEMDLMELIKLPYYNELLSYSQISNPNPSPDDYCSRYDLHCSKCGAYYSIHYAHDFQNGACTRGYCGHIKDPNYVSEAQDSYQEYLSNNESLSYEEANNGTLKLERKLNN